MVHYRWLSFTNPCPPIINGTHAHPCPPMPNNIAAMPTYAHLCPPMNKNIVPMPTQNPLAWALMGVGMGAHCRSLVGTHASSD
jgi:hypothetical protein